MIIKDELYGTIEFSELEKKIIDTPDFQRLHRIKQMALTYLVYPGATYTRFEHSLGTCHLASVIAEKLNIDKDIREKIRLYALIHDIGHVAFSHESEVILKRYLGNHEEIGKNMILSGEIGDILRETHNPKEIVEMEKSQNGKIVTSDLGADRMDYLRRDSHNTGAAYGIMDFDRILHTLRMRNGELFLTEGGLTSAESLLIGRYMMFSNVYMHKTVRIAAAMLRRMIKCAITGGFNPREFLKYGDEEALINIARIDEAKKYVEMIHGRKLYKEILSIEISDNSKIDIDNLEEKLIKKTNCDVIVDYPNEIFKPVDINIALNNKLVQITKISDIVEALRVSEKRRKKLMILGKEEDRIKIIELAKKELRL
ncbi:MAG: HD domain-containing protein [Candidatus Micrarchaeota archaeon]|nr:HD domain-containing protein [Candidatus Micrarchaeota archaeon]